MKKILAIGNSFSQDATTLMELLSDELYVRNLYIGGCSLEGQCERARGDSADYEYQHNGQRETPRYVTLREGLCENKWDYITVQQESGRSGEYETYYPYLPELIEYVKKYSDAKICFHRTWAYEYDSDHGAFVRYNRDRENMWEKIKQTTDRVCAEQNLPIIDSGEMIARLRRHEYFDPQKGGLSLCRDGFHLSLNYGRTATACVWIKFFTGKTPKYLSRPDLSEGYNLIREELKNFREEKL